MFFYTNTKEVPWTVVKSNDKKRARLEAMRYILNYFPYQEKSDELMPADPLIISTGEDVFTED